MTNTCAANEPVNSRALIIFAKNPLPGGVKTRLSPPLTADEASRLYSCMIQDSVAMAGALTGITPFIFFQDDPGAADYFKTLAPHMHPALQKGENLGQRMRNAFAEIFSKGYAEIAIIGTDSPDLPPEHIFEAFAMLEYEHTDVVFGPAEDGGYYLLAMKRVWDELFTGLPWSSDKLLAASVERARDRCLGASFLPQWYDIDTGNDLQRPELVDKNNRAVKTREFLISGHQPDNRHP